MIETNLSPAIKMNDIVSIATLLRDKGDKILNFSCKLTLTLDFLANLAEAFALIVDNVESSCFQVINTNNSSIEFLHDLQFLHDFVQKVLGLRLWSKTFRTVSKVELEKFRALRFLDLYGVPVQSIGICCTRDKLKSLTCCRCNLKDLKNLLEPEEALESMNSEDGVIDIKRIWVCLEEVFLPHNAIKYLGSSLRYVPRLRVLDLSHNNLIDLSALDHHTQNLEWLNVSYNRLKTIPILTNCTKLKVLLISDNQLEDLKGLCRMLSLQHVDVSKNLLWKHSSLEPLVNLPLLEKLQLEGNPIAFKRGHRLLTIVHLNPSALASRIFLLDGTPLSSLEKSYFSSKLPFGYKGSVGNVGVGCSRLDCYSQTLPTQPSSCTEHQCVALVGQPKNLQDMKMEVAMGGRSIRIREAPIADGEECQPNKYIEKQSVHLETKKNIESLRKTFGEENWLHGGGGLRVLNILGLQLDSTNSPSSMASNTPSSSPPSVAELSHGKVLAEGERELKGVETEVEEADEKEVVEAEERELDDGIREQEEGKYGVEVGVFVVQRMNECEPLLMDDLLLVVTDRQLLERDGANGQVVAQWKLSCLLGTLLEKEGGSDGSRVFLMFRGRHGMTEERSYYLDDEEAKELLRILEGILEAMHTITTDNVIQFTCIRCSTNFFGNCPLNIVESCNMEGKKKNEGEDAAPLCPKCGSAVVVLVSAEEVNDLVPVTGVLTESVGAGTTSNKDFTSVHSENKSLFSSWVGSKLSTAMKTDFEASNLGLQLHVLLNVLPDGEGKDSEFNIQEVVVFQESLGESFHGHMVLSKDSVYILREAVQSERDGRGRSSSEDSSEPVLVEWHLLSNCQTITQIYSGYLIEFGPQPLSSLWVFPRHQKQMQEAMGPLCSSIQDLQGFQSGEQRVTGGKILIVAPIAFSTSISSQSDCAPPAFSEILHGILILTSAVISIWEFKELRLLMSDFDYVSSCNKRVSDLIGLDAAPNSFLQLPGVVLHFSGEEDDDKYVVWPWGEGVLLELMEAMRGPWEDLFSVPLEAIFAQTPTQG